MVDPVFGRYAVLLSVIAGILELVPIIGPIISAVPAVLLAATAGPVAVARRARPVLRSSSRSRTTSSCPKIQGDAVELHPAAVIFAIIIGGSLAGLLGAILALPVTAAFRDVVRYLFRRLSPGRARGARRCSLGRDRAWDPADGLTPSTRTRSSRSTRRPRTRSSRPPTARLARKYHPDSRRDAEAAARMAAINAAWELIGDPAARRRVRPRAASRDAPPARRSTGVRGPTAGAGPSQPRPSPAGPARDRHRARRPRAEPEVVSRDWTSGRSTRAAATTSRCAPPKGTAPPGRRPAGRPGACSTSAGTRAGRSARSRGTTSSTSSGSIGRRSGGNYRDEIDEILRSTRPAQVRPTSEASDRRGLYRRR